MKILLYVLLAFGVFCFFSCKRTEKEQLTFLMKEWTRKEILFHDRAVFTIQGKDTLDKFPYASTYYKIVTYVDSLGCLSCKLQLDRKASCREECLRLCRSRWSPYH